MSRKPTLPGVDEEALASLARMFPPNSGPGAQAENKGKAPAASSPVVVPPKPAEMPPPAQPPAGQTASSADKPKMSPPPSAEAPATKPTDALRAVADQPANSPRGAPSDANKAAGPTAGPMVVPQSRGGSGPIAWLALLVALVALAVAGSYGAPSELIERLRAAVGPNQALDMLTERRAAIDAQFAADATAVKDLDGRLAAAISRLDAIEAVGGSNQAAAKRVDALEAAVNALVERAGAHEEAVRAAIGRLNNVQLHAVDIDNALKAASDRIGLAEEATKETGTKMTAIDEAHRRLLSELSSSIDALQKIDRRPERLYLAAIQLRGALQGSAPYGKELAAVAGLAGNGDELRAALKVLAARADTGVPTVPELRAAFAKAVSSRVAAAPGNRDSVTDRGFAWVRSWLPSGPSRAEASDSRNAAAVAMAERSLGEGQLAAAVDQLLLLEDRAALLAAEWLREASARLAVDKASVAVTSQAFEQLKAAP